MTEEQIQQIEQYLGFYLPESERNLCLISTPNRSDFYREFEFDPESGGHRPVHQKWVGYFEHIRQWHDSLSPEGQEAWRVQREQPWHKKSNALKAEQQGFRIAGINAVFTVIAVVSALCALQDWEIFKRVWPYMKPGIVFALLYYGGIMVVGIWGMLFKRP